MRHSNIFLRMIDFTNWQWLWKGSRPVMIFFALVIVGAFWLTANV